MGHEVSKSRWIPLLPAMSYSLTPELSPGQQRTVWITVGSRTTPWSGLFHADLLEAVSGLLVFEGKALPSIA